MYKKRAMMHQKETTKGVLPGLEVDGCFLRAGGRRVHLRGTAYGPFPTNPRLSYLPEASEWESDLARIRAAGFNCLRVYHVPPQAFLDACADHGLWVWIGVPWTWHIDFIKEHWARREGLVRWQQAVRSLAGHPAIAGWLVANEIPATMVRWLGWRAVRDEIEQWIAVGKQIDSTALFGYATYPPTEWLQPRNADFIACNIYLEERERFATYLKRQQHLAAGRPLIISEFGCDHKQHGHQRQLEIFSWFWQEVRAAGCSGGVWFTWSDNWRDPRGGVIEGWQFGLVGVTGGESPALEQAPHVFAQADETGRPPEYGPQVSVLVCSRNGRERIGACLESLRRQSYADREVIVVDDGSTDGTAAFVAAEFPEVRLLELPPSGLGAARNAAAGAARGSYFAFLDDDCEADEEWLAWLMRGFIDQAGAALGGPNVPPVGARGLRRALDLAPSTAQPVMLDDTRAEHLPGCNLAVRRDAFDAVGGFNPAYHTAGDDVDFCWKLEEKGYPITYFAPAMVWHARRQTLSAYLRQQTAYGRAEAILAEHWSERTGPFGAHWTGRVYGSGLGRNFRVYQGAFGYAEFVRILDKNLGPEEPWLESRLQIGFWRLLRWLQPWARAFGRWRAGMRPPGWPCTIPRETMLEGEYPEGKRLEWQVWSPSGHTRDALLPWLQTSLEAQGWRVVADDGWHLWDLRAEKSGTAWISTVTEYDEKPGRLTRVRVQSNDRECIRLIGREIDALKKKWEAEAD